MDERKISLVGIGAFLKCSPEGRGKRNLCFSVGGWVSH